MTSRRALLAVLLTVGCTDVTPTDDARGAAPTTPSVWFRDASEASGLVFVHDAGTTPEKHLPETMAPGAALVDLDGDGDLDVYLVQSGPMPVGDAPRDPSRVNRTYLNDGTGRFIDVTDRSGDGAHDGYGMGVAAGDVDGDGDLDLYVTNFGPDVLLRNDGDGRFTDVTAASGLGDDRWTSGATFFDAEGDGDADLFVTGYVQVDVENPIWCGPREEGLRSYCHPDAYDGLPDRYWRNRGDGTFEEATAAAGLASPGQPGKGLGVVAFDADDDGHLDLYVANDSVENRLWLGAGDGTFVDGTLLSGTGVNGRGLTEAGMGLAAGDVDNDGDLDLVATNFDDESNTLYRNDGDGLFTDVTIQARLEAPSRLPVGFGTVLSDLDHDHDLDLVVANGHIVDTIHLLHDGKTHAQFAQMFVNDGAARFVEVGREALGDLAARPLVGRGLYDGDVDGDGDRDLLLTVCDGPALLLVNEVGAARGTSVIVSGLPPGTRLVATLDDGSQLVRDAGGRPSYFGVTSPAAHFGLGAARIVELAWRTPTGLSGATVLDPPVASGRLRLATALDDGLPRFDRMPHRAAADAASPSTTPESPPR